MASYVTTTNILKTRVLEEQCTHFNKKLRAGDDFPHSRNMKNGTFFKSLKCKVNNS